MIAIVAVDENWGIGNKGDLLISLPEDQKDNFRQKTLGNTIVLGRKTLDTFPGGKLLPKRKHIILSRNHSFVKEGAIVLHSSEELLHYKEEHPQEKIFLIGGEEIYRNFLPYCSMAVVTHIKASFTADAYFPDLSKIPGWEQFQTSEKIKSIKGYDFTITQYENLYIDKPGKTS